MLAWLHTALNTYVLHTEHGDGYQWWSGAGSDLGLAAAITAFLLKHNCHEHRCWRVGRMHGADGAHRCKRHHQAAP
jgi:hypothetical protein